MKNIKLSLIAILGLGTLAYAGGDISPVTPYEIEDVRLAEEAQSVMVTEMHEVEVTPSVVAPPVVVETMIAVPPPVVMETQEENRAEIKSVESTEEPVNNGIYLGLGAVVAQYDTNCDCSNNAVSGTDKTGGFMGKVGYSLNKYVAVEARGMKTMIEEDGGEIEHMGVFLKPSYPMGDASIYGLLGWAKTETSGSLRKTDVDGLAWGLGLDYGVADNVSLFVDYEKLFQESDAPKLDALSIGANYKF